MSGVRRRVKRRLASLCRGIHRERRLRAPHACEPPSRQLRRLLRHPSLPRPRTGCLPQATRQHSLSPHPPPETIPANLPIAGRKRLVLVSLGGIPLHTRPGSYPEVARQCLVQSSTWWPFYVWRSLSRPPSSELFSSSPVSSGSSS